MLHGDAGSVEKDEQNDGPVEGLRLDAPTDGHSEQTDKKEGKSAVSKRQLMCGGGEKGTRSNHYTEVTIIHRFYSCPSKVLGQHKKFPISANFRECCFYCLLLKALL